MKYSEKLKLRYIAELSETITENFLDKEKQLITDECGYIVYSVWLGSVLLLYPSGKIYAPWTTNQTLRDIVRDQAFTEALEQVAENFNYFPMEFSGDIFLQSVVDDPAECFLTNDGITFFRGTGANTERFNSYADVIKTMENEGYFPGIYYTDLHGGIHEYIRSEWDHIS